MKLGEILMKKPIGILFVTLLLVVGISSIGFAQSEDSTPDEFAVVFEAYPDDEYKFDVQVFNVTKNEEALRVTVEDVYAEHYHNSEAHNGNLYIIKRTGDINTDDWMDELWKYDSAGGATLLFSSQGMDFRVAPDESYIALRYPLPPDFFYDGLGFLDLAGGGELVQEFLFESIPEELSIGLEGWSDDSGKLWVKFSAGPSPVFYSKVDTTSWQTTEFDLADASVGHKNDLNPNTGKVVFSDLPAFFDAMSAQLFIESENPVTLFLYDLETAEIQTIADTIANAFAPKWLDDNTIEFNDPASDFGERTIYLLDPSVAQVGEPAEVFPVNIPEGFEMPMQTLVLSYVPPILPAEFPVEAGLPTIYPYIYSSDTGLYEATLDYGDDCFGAGACSFGSMMARKNEFGVPQGTENNPYDFGTARKVILAKGIQGYFIESQCGASCSDALIFWLYDGNEYMFGVKAASKENVIALANAAIENSIP